MSNLYKKAGGTFIIKILGLGIAFIFQVILGRYLKPELYGQYTMFLTYANIFSILAVLGMDQNLIKEIAKIVDNSERSKEILIFVFKILLLTLSIIAIIVIVFHSALSTPLNMIQYLLIMILIRALALVLDGYFQGKGFIVKVTFINILLNNIFKIVLFMLFSYIVGAGLFAALGSFICGESIALLLRACLFGRKRVDIEKDTTSLTRKDKKGFVKYSVTVALIACLGIMLQNVDKIMIANMLDFKYVGIYKVAQNYVGLIGVFISPFVAFWPMISKLYFENRIDEIEVEMKRIVRIVTYLALPMFFVFGSLATKLLYIFGKEYVTSDAKLVLIILSFAYLIDAVSGPIGSILTMTKYAKFILINNIGSLLLNIALNVIFISMYGIIGVAVGTGVSIIANNIISIIEVKCVLNIFAYELKNVKQIFFFSVLNYLITKGLLVTMNISNTILYIIIFTVIVYAVNILCIFFVEKDLILKFINRSRL